MENNYICHSGGCSGSDMEWENECNKYNIKTISYSFSSHIQEGKQPYIMNSVELEEGWEHVKTASKGIKRPLYKIQYNPYVRNLLCRNWFQVKHSNAIYAIGTLFTGSDKIVNGGTGWAVQMAIDNKKDVFLFEQNFNKWYLYNYTFNVFQHIDYTPILLHSFAGIGTREINENGKNAIKEILKLTYERFNNRTSN